MVYILFSTLQRVSSWPAYHFSAIKKRATRSAFEIRATKAKICVFTGPSRCHGNLLRHDSDRIFYSNNCSFLWYHNIAVA